MNENSKCLVIEFDYGQNLPVPKLNVNSQFYKRLLWYNVFNVYCHNVKNSVMYCYIETVQKKKNSESVASFLHHFIERKLNSSHVDYKDIVLFSDNAGGQNKNLIMFMFCSYLAVSLKTRVS